MQANFSFSTTTFFVATLIALIFLVGLIFTFRYILSKKSQQEFNQRIAERNNQNPLIARKKYPGFDIFNYSNQFFLLGIVMALLMSVFAFNWTTFDQKIDIPDNALVIEEDIEIEPPRSTELPPPPPPPPPPVIEEVPNELLTEEDDVEFVDQSIDKNTEITITPVKVTKKEDAPAPPPPPPPPAEEEEIFVVVEQMPMFPGCEEESDVNIRKECSNKKLLEFIYENIKYPAVAKDNGVQGTVVLKFVVDERGNVGNIQLVKDIGANCGQEALRVVNLMNEQNLKWEPGKQRGRPVKVWFMLPVKFQLV